jgi:Predicted membrane GTPase involved in stress response
MENLRNIAIIAPVDHGKTTLIGFYYENKVGMFQGKTQPL